MNKLSFARRACLLVIACGLAQTSVWAEGSQSFGGGAHGVNRVIRTTDSTVPPAAGVPASSGYTGVQGTVTLGFTMPKNERTDNHSYEKLTLRVTLGETQTAMEEWTKMFNR